MRTKPALDRSREGLPRSAVPSDRAMRAVKLLREAMELLSEEGAENAKVHRAETDRLLRLPEVQHLTGLGRSAVYEQMRSGRFPQSVKVGLRSATWSERAVQAWIAQRLEPQP
jgi:prophage regulatory protein